MGERMKSLKLYGMCKKLLAERGSKYLGLIVEPFDGLNLFLVT